MMVPMMIPPVVVMVVVVMVVMVVVVKLSDNHRLFVAGSIGERPLILGS